MSDSKKTVVITGASRGIGEAVARRFAVEGGYRLVLCAKTSADRLSALAEEFSARPDTEVCCSVGDVSDESYVASLFSDLDGGADILVNCAGTDAVGLLQDQSASEIRRVLDTNLTGTILCCKYAIPQLLAKGSGAIVNLSSLYAATGAAGEAVYAATKGGIDALTKSLARELGRSGIRVNALAPGYVDTDMNAALSAEDRALLEEEIPLGRAATPEETAEAVFQLADGLTYCNGTVLRMDGGWLA